MYQRFITQLEASTRREAMETETAQKNGANPQSRMSWGRFAVLHLTLLMVAIMSIFTGCKEDEEEKADDFVAVSSISGVPTVSQVNSPLTLAATVSPSNATNQTIIWSVKEAGTTGAAITGGNTLTTTTAGTVTVNASITNGATRNSPFSQDFTIIVNENFVAVSDISDVPTETEINTPLTLTATVSPINATNQTIVWTIKEAETTGANITDGNILTATDVGTVTVTATITNGASASTPFAKDFSILINTIDEKIEVLYQEIEQLADSILMSEHPDYSSLVELYKNHELVESIYAEGAVFSIKFVDGLIYAWTTKQPALTEQTQQLMSFPLNLTSALTSESMKIRQGDNPSKIAFINCQYYETDASDGANVLYHQEVARILYYLFRDTYGWETDSINGNAASLDFFANQWSNYDAIFLNAHGDADNTNFFGREAHTWTVTNIDWRGYSKDKKNTLKNQYGEDCIRFSTSWESLFKTSKHIDISEVFFDKHYPDNSFKNPFIYLVNCRGMYHDLNNNASLAQVLIKKGASAVVGWSNYNLRSSRMNVGGQMVGFSMLVEMLENEKSLQESFKWFSDEGYAVNEFPTQDISLPIGQETKPFSAHLIYAPSSAGDYKLPFLSVSPSSLTFPASGGEQMFTISSSTDWTVSCDNLWLTMKPTSGSNNSSITVSVDSHNTNQRTAIIHIKGKGVQEKTVSVTQEEYIPDPELTAIIDDPSNIPASGGTRVITITSNTDWTISSDASWLTLPTGISPGSGNRTFTITIPSHTSTSNRSATLTITGSGIVQTINIVQNGIIPVLVANIDNASNLPASGGTRVITITSNIAWTVSSDASWLTIPAGVSPGSGNRTFTITIPSHTSTSNRSAQITITGSGISQIINIIQDAEQNVGNNQGTEINGLVWAYCNVGAPGTFVQNPENFGEYYQWNKRTPNWSAGWNNGGVNSWLPANDPCPTGWRVPTGGELDKMRDLNKVTHEWTSQNGVVGRKLIDKASGNSVFFPAAGYLSSSNGSYWIGSYNVERNGYYWCSTKTGGQTDGFTISDSSNNFGHTFDMYYGSCYSVRCVSQ